MDEPTWNVFVKEWRTFLGSEVSDEGLSLASLAIEDLTNFRVSQFNRPMRHNDWIDPYMEPIEPPRVAFYPLQGIYYGSLNVWPFGDGKWPPAYFDCEECNL